MKKPKGRIKRFVAYMICPGCLTQHMYLKNDIKKFTPVCFHCGIPMVEVKNDRENRKDMGKRNV